MEFKRGLVVLVILILSLFLIEIFTGAITGRFIFDTRAVQDTLSTSVVVIQNFPPNLTLYEPSSRVYVGDYGIWILYEVVDDSSSVSSVWFNLDNGTNMTLPLPSGGNFATSSFNSSDGDHVFYIFANDTNNNVNDSVNVNFTVVDFFDSNETFVDSDGNLIFNDTEINEFVKNISGLDPSWTINFTLYDNETPVTWEDPTGLGKKMFHFELFANTQNDTSGSFTMYFNLSQARLGSVVAEDIRGFFFNNNIWNELITTVENSDGDPLEFSVALTHLSRFLIAEKESTDGGGAGSGSGVGSSRGRSRPSETPSKIPEILEEPKEEEPKEEPKLEFPRIPFLSKLREIQELPLLNIIAVFLGLTIVVLIIIWSESRFKKKRKKRKKK